MELAPLAIVLILFLLTNINIFLVFIIMVSQFYHINTRRTHFLFTAMFLVEKVWHVRPDIINCVLEYAFRHTYVDNLIRIF